MSILAALRSTDTRSYWQGPYNIKDPLTGSIFNDAPVSAGVSVNEYTALNYSAVWAAVQRIAGDVGSLPLVLYKRVGDGKEPLRDHPLYRILHDQPNPEMTAVVFRETLQAHALTWGNAYAEIEWRVGGGPRALWPIAPNRVTPERNATGELYYKVQNGQGKYVYIESANMLHIPGFGFDGTCGYSAIKMARESIGLGIATERFGGAFFGNGTTFGGILTHPNRLTDPARKNIRESIKALHGGVNGAHKFGLFEEGMTYTQLGVPPDDAQFLETRKFQVTEVARWFLIPPHMLGDLERATFSNIEQQQIDYTTGTLRRWLVRWEQECKRKLVLQDKTQFVEHVIDGLLRGDIESRYAAYAVGRNWGWLSADDVRAKENQNPLPDNSGQIYLVPTNMAPASRINEIVDAQIKDPAPAVGGGNDSSARLAELISELGAQVESLGTYRSAAEGVVEALAVREVAIGAAVGQLLEARAALQTVHDQMNVGNWRTGESVQRLDDLRQQHETAVKDIEALLAGHVRERDDLVRELVAIREAATADRVAREKAEQRATDATAHEAEVRTEWVAAQRQMQSDLDSHRQAFTTGLDLAHESLTAEQQARVGAESRAEAQAVVAGEATHEAAELRSEWLKAQAAHQEKLDTERSERVRLQTELTRQTELLAALESDVAHYTTQLDQARDAHAAAVKAADEAREAERVALAEKVVSVEAVAAHSSARIAAETHFDKVLGQFNSLVADLEVATSARDSAHRTLEDTTLALEASRKDLHDNVLVSAERAESVLALETELQAAKADLERERQRATAAETRADTASGDLVAHRTAETDRMAGMLGAIRDRVAATVARIATREAERARAHQATPAKLRRWLESFVTLETPMCIDNLKPDVRTHLTWMQSTEDATVVTTRLVMAHMNLFVARLLSACESDDYHATLEAVLQQWESDRPREIADAVLQEGIAHVRAR